MGDSGVGAHILDGCHADVSFLAACVVYILQCQAVILHGRQRNLPVGLQFHLCERFIRERKGQTIVAHSRQDHLAIALQLIGTILEFEAVTSNGYQRLIFLFYACGIVLGTAAVDAIGYQEAWTAAPRDDSELYGVEDAGHFRATEFIDPIEALIKTRHGSKKQGDRPCYRNTGVFGGVGGCVV